ncbi:MAG: hypothetical protein ACI9XC_001753, partial [Gammaproteobacteria bacterium]
MIIQDREESRRVFFQAWQKFRQAKPMEPLESLICSVIQEHPEYHSVLEEKQILHEEFSELSGKQNLFLHLGLHIALMEQVGTDRPAGITSLYQSMLGKCPDGHALEHQIMECLEQSL